MTVKRCSTCKYSKPRDGYNNRLYCYHDKIVSEDDYALASKEEVGSNCNTERSKWWFFAICGKSGKLWEEKDEEETGPTDLMRIAYHKHFLTRILQSNILEATTDGPGWKEEIKKMLES